MTKLFLRVYDPKIINMLPTMARPGQFLNGRPPGKTTLLLQEVLVRPCH